MALKIGRGGMEKKDIIFQFVRKGFYGLEKETLRVCPDGFLADTTHPFANNPNIERDFCENQTEFLTDVWDCADSAWEQLKKLQQQAVRILKTRETGEELLWPFSNPPYIRSEKEIPIADFQGKQRSKIEYRNYLAEKYGKKKMLYSGIHFNFSFSEEMFDILFQQGNDPSLEECKNNVYLDLAKKVMKYDWLLVYLMAASPVMDGSFRSSQKMGTEMKPQYSSYRCGEKGYWNTFAPILDYRSLDHYIDSIESYVTTGKLLEAKELYYPVRLKPKGENSLDNLRKGVDHIELRMLDLNPFSPVGITKEDLDFLQLFLFYLTAQKEGTFSKQEQEWALRNAKKAAEFDDHSIQIITGVNQCAPLRKLALSLLTDMEQFFRDGNNPSAVKSIQFQQAKVSCPQERYAARVQKRFGRHFVQKGIQLAQDYAEKMEEEELIYVRNIWRDDSEQTRDQTISEGIF